VHLLGLVLWRWIDLRLFYPIQPFLMCAFLLGLETLLILVLSVFKVKTRLVHIFIGMVMLFIAAASVYSSSRIERSWDHTFDLEKRTLWIRENTDPDTVILSEFPIIDYLYSDHKTVSYIDISESTDPIEFLKRNRVDLVLITPNCNWNLTKNNELSNESIKTAKLIKNEALKRYFKSVYSNDDESIYIFEFDPDF
jgi:hypothetical protein